jgi:type III secretion protein U
MLALAGWGVVDWLFARDRHRRALMTTPEEARRERREVEGDPRHRRERQRLHRELVERSSVDDVRQADFVVVDRGRLAVAVSYHPGGHTVPLLAAKGRRLLAERMEQTAQAWNVPVHHDAALAQALNGVVEGDPIPESLYQAVANMLQASWARSSKGSPFTAWKRP